MTAFKKGEKVNLYVSIGGIVTTEKAKVLKIDKKGVWLDNGVGNDPSGPFDPNTGRKEMFLGSQRIEKL